jgi:hypothetical protein
MAGPLLTCSRRSVTINAALAIDACALRSFATRRLLDIGNTEKERWQTDIRCGTSYDVTRNCWRTPCERFVRLRWPYSSASLDR